MKMGMGTTILIAMEVEVDIERQRQKQRQRCALAEGLLAVCTYPVYQWRYPCPGDISIRSG